MNRQKREPPTELEMDFVFRGHNTLPEPAKSLFLDVVVAVNAREVTEDMACKILDILRGASERLR